MRNWLIHQSFWLDQDSVKSNASLNYHHLVKSLKTTFIFDRTPSFGQNLHRKPPSFDPLRKTVQFWPFERDRSISLLYNQSLILFFEFWTVCSQSILLNCRPISVVLAVHFRRDMVHLEDPAVLILQFLIIRTSRTKVTLYKIQVNDYGDVYVK